MQISNIKNQNENVKCKNYGLFLKKFCIFPPKADNPRAEIFHFAF